MTLTKNKASQMKMKDLRSEFSFFVCAGFFLPQILALVEIWVTAFVLTGWFSNEVGTVYVC